MFTEDGSGSQAAATMLLSYLDRNRYKLNGSSFGFFENPEYPQVTALQQLIGQRGRDFISSFLYPGTHAFCRAGIEELFRWFHGPSTGHALCSPTATIAIQHAVQTAMNRYYQNNEHDYSVRGHDEFPPVIIAPVNAEFLIARVAQACGLGSKAVHYYNLKSDGQVDLTSYEALLEQLRRDGRKVALNFMLAGDSQGGIVHDIPALSERCPEAYQLVDATLHGFTLWAQGRATEFDFSIPAVDGLIVSIRKIGFGTGAFLLQRKVESTHSWLVSNDATPFLAFFATLSAQGNDWFRTERLRTIAHARIMRHLLGQRPDLFELLPCDNNLFCFTTKRGGARGNRSLAEAINGGGCYFICYSELIRACTTEHVAQLKAQFSVNQFSDYDGLWGHIGPHHTPKNLNDFFQHICGWAETL